MRPNKRGAVADTLRPESQPHGTTEDQIHEMESEGQGGAATQEMKPKPLAPLDKTATGSPASTVAK